MVEVFDIHMIHFHNDLGHIDNTVSHHRVPRRLFKITEELYYDSVEHPILKGNFNEVGTCDVSTIFHLAHINHCFNIKGRYENNIKKSNIHSKEFLDNWNEAHCLGVYPNKPINPVEIPEIILNYFHINKDKFYFANRGLELKHFQMARQWLDFFDDDNTIFEIIEFGCGKAPYGYTIELIEPETYKGVELSQYAVDHSFIPNKVVQGNIINYTNEYPAKLVIAFDVLEHIDYKDLGNAIDNLIKNSSKYLLISVPVIGDPNLENDKTHKIFETKEWWIKQFTDKGLKQVPTPDNFMFKEQILIFEKNV